MGQFVSFRDCMVTIGAFQVYATSVSLDMQTSLTKDIRFDSFDIDQVGATVNNPTLTPTDGVKGTLSVDFVISKQHFIYDEVNNRNTIASIFELNKQTSTALQQFGRVGEYRFFNAGLKSFSFSMRPFDLVRATAEYEIFGSIIQISKELDVIDNLNPAEGLKSFGDVVVDGINLQDKSRFNVQLLSAQYSVRADRKYNFSIRANEHPVANYVPGAIMPYRVSLSGLVIETRITSNKIIPAINETGKMQHGFGGEDFSAVEVALQLFEAKDEAGDGQSNLLAKFGCAGQVTQQSLSAQDGSYLNGNFTVRQVVK
jgi:hypothetical protein